ncbi:carboxyl transferase domain-containing protein [Brevibacterium jeotgali]|uniref:Acetyl/propionyl-CoA carboxylase, alpha subunit n=1 Tax=Brevibacterium jeotgali TaxID=1262550 RepID=A0A2H1L6M7_9MICO|nr:carboxyl transferase domain-containing protein [Brevibacterium jeotgali]TWC02619.1 acetyl/propionyl-CoA carboxylase alpha subunit [Brevibacterium jeotgali]SMY12529.1 Acetyl/propionyl-CoA carboxylase, alpha subunit [Brevibacterium jeotgali]
MEDAGPGILIANRGEIAVRVVRAARAAGLRTIVVRATDEEALGTAGGLHLGLADEVVTLPGRGASAYLDASAIIAAATHTGASLVHPGYGFLAESADLARRCAEIGLTWVGPDPHALELFGDKTATRAHARSVGVAVPAATGLLEPDRPAGAGDEPAVAEARALLDAHPDGVAVKAVAGGGGRGIRIVHQADALSEALTACSAEARAGFGDGRIFAEGLVVGARHIEVQVIGTPSGVHVLGDRDCSIQRRRQKLVEIAPAPGLDEDLRARIHADALRLVEPLSYQSLATVEFLVTGGTHVLLEVNPRIQVEHTVTEEVMGIDLVACQLEVAAGRVPALPTEPAPRGTAVQLRVAAESTSPAGDPVPSVGTVTAVTWPTGPGVRVDTWIGAGTRVTGVFDALLAKVIAHGDSLAAALHRADRALAETRIEGLDTSTGLLRAVGEQLDPGRETTTAFDACAAQLAERARELDAAARARDMTAGTTRPSLSGPAGGDGRVGAASAVVLAEQELGPDQHLLRAAVSGTVVAIGDAPGEYVLLEAMKMHHPVPGPPSSHVRHLVGAGDYVPAGSPVAVLTGAAPAGTDAVEERGPHPGVAEVRDRHAAVADDQREDALAAIRARGRRTARENIDDLVDPGTFVEYGPLVIAAQTRRRSVEDLVDRTSGDGLIGGVAKIEEQEVVVMSYDYSVLAGTQGTRNHAKTDRLLELAARRSAPVVLFAEGGGGRPGDTDRAPTSGLSVPTFGSLAALRGRVPLVAVVSGRSFAGNAALAGVCDLIIATPDANIGMGGPAMIEGGGLGRHRSEDIGPVEVHESTGVVDVVARDEAEAVATARRLLGCLSVRSEPAAEAAAPPADSSRSAVPADRLRAFSMRAVLASVADAHSLIEVRPRYAPGAITGFLRIAGAPFAFLANDNSHLGGAIDVDAARSFAQHLGLADDHGLPVLSFVDTPGFMVGPDAEREPGVRAFGDLFVAGARLRSPLGAFVIRKGYGLGAMAMAGGGFDAPHFTVAWPSGEIGPMGLEGAVRLGHAKELAAISDADVRAARESELVEELYAQGRALSAAMVFDVDDVIDPADSRAWAKTIS